MMRGWTVNHRGFEHYGEVRGLWNWVFFCQSGMEGLNRRDVGWREEEQDDQFYMKM